MEDRARGVSRKEPAQISCSEKKEQEAFGCPYKTAAASNNRMNTKKESKDLDSQPCCATYKEKATNKSLYFSKSYFLLLQEQVI